VEFLTDGELGLEIIEDPPPLQTTNGTTALLRFYFAPYSFPDPASIARREWLYGRHYIRGGISASVGAPGRAKSTTVLSEIMSMAVGRDLLTGESLPAGPISAAYLNGEGTQDELDPRVAVICQYTGILPEDFGDRLFASAGRW